MNANLPDDHASIRYYDSDYPGRETPRDPETRDNTALLQDLVQDVERYLELATLSVGPVLELCCGTGRVAIPLARAGFQVTGVDRSAAMLERFRERLEREERAVAQRITLEQADITKLQPGEALFPLVIMAFNSLLCLTDFASQRAAIAAAQRQLQPDGLLALDLMNPLILTLPGDAVPKPFFTRRNLQNGNVYTRFAAMGPMQVDQVQELFGWYDEIGPDGVVRRSPYSMHWRPVFRYEIELMLETAGLMIESVEGGHRKEPFTPQSRKMFILARRKP